MFLFKVNVVSFIDKVFKLEGVIVIVIGIMEGNSILDVWKGIIDKNGFVYWDKKLNGDCYINENFIYIIMFLVDLNKFYEDKKGVLIFIVGLNYD